MKRILYILFFISIGTTYAQQDAMFTYYMFNHQAVNPAYVGQDRLSMAQCLTAHSGPVL